MAIEVTATFNPVLFSLEENKFLLAHLGEPPQIALRLITSQRLPEPSRDTKTGKKTSMELRKPMSMRRTTMRGTTMPATHTPTIRCRSNSGR